MKALQVLGPSTGGIRRHVGTLAPGLEERGWEVEVAGPEGVLDGVLAGVVPVAVDLGPEALGAIRQLRPMVRDADVIHAHGLKAGWIAWAAGAGPRLVVTVHNVVLDQVSGRSTPVLRTLEGWLPGRAQETIVISADMRRRFDPHGTRTHLHTIPPAGPAPQVTRTRHEVRAELGVPDGVPLVVLVGRLHKQKSIDTLIDAVAQLERPLWVAVVGEGPEEAALRSHIERLGLEAVVYLVGRHDDAGNYQAAADVVVMCSTWEGFGLVVAEALHLGRPLVATAVGPVPELVIDGQTGRLVAPSDPKALAGAIDDLLADPGRAAALGAAGAKLVADLFDVPALIDRVADVYHLIPPKAPR